MVFFPQNILIFSLQARFKRQLFFHSIYKFIEYLFLFTGINHRIFLKSKTETNKQTRKPFIILKLFIPTASWELLMSAGESGWYQELNIPSSLGSLWRARKAPKTTGWKKPIFLLGELVSEIWTKLKSELNFSVFLFILFMFGYMKWNKIKNLVFFFPFHHLPFVKAPFSSWERLLTGRFFNKHNRKERNGDVRSTNYESLQRTWRETI